MNGMNFVIGNPTEVSVLGFIVLGIFVRFFFFFSNLFSLTISTLSRKHEVKTELVTLQNDDHETKR